MDPNIDIAKLVGAASAPVALVIATCIYLGNLTTKYNTLFEKIRTLAQELREKPEKESESDHDQQRRESLHEQLNLYELRIAGTMRCAFWLNVAIIFFICTVLMTGVDMIFPKNAPLILFTAAIMFGGLIMVVGAIVVELYSNRLAKPTLDSELTRGTPQYQAMMAGRS